MAKMTIKNRGNGEQVRGLGTPDEVSTYLQVPVQTLYRWRHQGVGPRSSRVGRHIRYRWADVERWLDEQS